MSVTTGNSQGATAIRPFTIPEVPESELEMLRARIAATRWPDEELVTDDSQGVPLAMVQELAHYWATDYDWRRCEATLNALPQFALPLIVTHGWPGSGIEQLKIIDPLTNPTAHGASASDAFHLVIPSLPGYGFTGKPQETGWDPAHIVRAWVVLMKRLGYPQFASQGGDWGGAVTNVMARQASPGLLGIHVNFPAVSVFPGENYQAPRSWTERAYHNLIYYHQLDKGGHFAAWEQPQIFSEEVRAGLRPLRK